MLLLHPMQEMIKLFADQLLYHLMQMLLQVETGQVVQVRLIREEILQMQLILKQQVTWDAQYQLHGMDLMLMALVRVLLVQVPQNIIVERLAGRRTCKKCGALCHVVFNPPKQAGVCDRCGGELYQRDDDREQTITHRLQVYENQTAPLVNYYSQRGLLRTVDGVGEIAQIRARVIAALGDLVQ